MSGAGGVVEAGANGRDDRRLAAEMVTEDEFDRPAEQVGLRHRIPRAARLADVSGVGRRQSPTAAGPGGVE